MKRLLSAMLLASVAMVGQTQTFTKATMGGQAQTFTKKEKTITLGGYIIDLFTKTSVPQDSLRVLLLNTDSVVVDTAGVYSYRNYSGFDKTGWAMNVPARPAKYIIKAMHPDYETTFMDFEIKRVSRNRYFEVPVINMHRTQRSNYDKEGGALQEVVVRATKVKMVYKGDTIVYNADAFNVPEGSMLDGLIKQMPGVELKENGEILVNGKKIENLTLNGADFFKGKNKMMLENLPYYTVKNIQVYNKETPKSKFLGRNAEQKEYTMDVVLKREYRVGGTVFVEGGYGTDNRYKGKAFGMRFSDHSRAVLFGGANNLNEYIDYDSEGNDRGRTNASGDRDIRQVGGLWTLNAKEERGTNTVEYNLRWEDNHVESRNHSENYLAGASTYGNGVNTSDSRPFQVNVRDNFQLMKPFFLYSWIDFSYDHAHSDSQSESLTARDVLFGDSINLSRSRSMGRSDRLSLSVNNQLTFKMPWGDQLELSLQGSFGRTWNAHNFSQNSYRFFSMGTLDQRNQYNDTPAKNMSVTGNIGYRLNLTDHLTLNPAVTIGYNYNNNDRSLYRLDWLGSEWAAGGPHAIGSLPDDPLLQQAMDHPNSTAEGSRQNTQSVGMTVSYNQQGNGYFMFLNASISERFHRNHMTYDVNQQHFSINKNYHFPQLFVNLNVNFDNWRKTVNLFVQNSSSMPTISQLIDIPSTYNPLNISKGNPDLQPMTYWSFNASYNVRTDSINQNIGVGMSGTVQHHAFANAYTYDPTTGVYTSWTENINGNWSLQGNITYSRALGKKKFWYVGSSLTASVNQSTDLSSVMGAQNMAAMTQQTGPQRNRVTSTRLSLSPNVRYQKEKLAFTIKADAAWQHHHRSIDVSGLPDNVYDFSYGFNASYQLPWHFTIDTDLQMHSRRGYADADMNDNRLYWDATLTKSWQQGRWVAKVKGYDLLGQVTHWQYYVNSNGRYETWTNNMRRYVLVSLAYRFSIMPRK